MTATDRGIGVVQSSQQGNRRKTTQGVGITLTRWGFALLEVIANSNRLAIFIN